MPGIDLSGFLLLLATFVPAAAFAGSHGYRSGLRGDNLGRTCLWAWLKVLLAVFIVNGLAASAIAIAALIVRAPNPLAGSVMMLLFGLALSLLYLPVAALSALLGHIIGMQRKTRSHLEKLDRAMAEAQATSSS